MILFTLILSFFINILKHGDFVVGILNVSLLFFSLVLYFMTSNQNISFKDLFFKNSPLIILLGTVPVFTRNNNIFIVVLTIGICLLVYLYLGINNKYKKLVALLVFIYILFACLYSSELLKAPFILTPYLLVVHDTWTNSYLTQMNIESQYLPSIIRGLLFNPLINIYVIFSKMAGMFTLKNIFDALLIVNIYPLLLGIYKNNEHRNKSKIFIYLCMLFIAFVISFSRVESTYNSFILLSPFLIYFVLSGLKFVNKKVYIILFAISLFISLGP